MLKWQEVLIDPGIGRIAIEPLGPFVPIEIVQSLALGRPLAVGHSIGLAVRDLTIYELDPAFGPPDNMRDIFGAKRHNFVAGEVFTLLEFEQLLEPSFFLRGTENVLGFRAA